ncbi:MAG TPA: hypothetical protein VKU62_06885 [Thermoanaerobaculia bacterium]|nr:hypothetical protein [Thermoanaerobaculia bacterium]
MGDFKNNSWPAPDEEGDCASGWRHLSVIAQVVFFTLTILAVAAAFGFFALLELPKGWIVLIGCVALAESLMRQQHFWRTGVEAALWIGGLYAFIFSLPSSGKPEALFVLAAAAAIAGWRVRNAIFGALALILVTAYFSVRNMPMYALAFACGVAIVALFACTRAWKRPSTEFLWQVLLLVMPVAGYVASDPAFLANETAIFVMLAIVFAIIGIRFRIRVPLIASGIAIAIAAIDAHKRIPLSAEVRLMIAGAIALTVAAAITRAIRNRTHGFVLDAQEPGELESIVTGVALLQVQGPPASPQPIGGGGGFGGAGASGDF